MLLHKRRQHRCLHSSSPQSLRAIVASIPRRTVWLGGLGRTMFKGHRSGSLNTPPQYSAGTRSTRRGPSRARIFVTRPPMVTTNKRVHVHADRSTSLLRYFSLTRCPEPVSREKKSNKTLISPGGLSHKQRKRLFASRCFVNDQVFCQWPSTTSTILDAIYLLAWLLSLKTKSQNRLPIIRTSLAADRRF